MSSVALPFSADRKRRWQHGRDIIAVLVERDIKVMYQRSWLGIGWALASPLLQLIVFVTVFRRVLVVPIEHYASSVFMGVLLWGWFQASLVQSTTLITANQALVRQPRFPLALLPHVTVGVRFIHLAIALPMLYLLLWYQGLRPNPAWLSLPVLLLVQFALTTGVAYPLAALNVRMRDTQHVTSVGLQLSMYLTPIFYSLEIIPPHLQPWFYLNPMVGIIESWRGVLLHGRWPEPTLVAALAIFSCGMLLVGRRIFIVQSHRFAEEL